MPRVAEPAAGAGGAGAAMPAVDTGLRCPRKQGMAEARSAVGGAGAVLAEAGEGGALRDITFGQYVTIMSPI